MEGALNNGARLADREISRSMVDDDFRGRNCTKVNFGKRDKI
jgi:hypothetical protein